MNNSLMVIYPYLDQGTWVFDDEAVGLEKEPFVSGVPEILESLLTKEKIPDPERGFRLCFSANPFPGYQIVATWIREDCGGNWYSVDSPQGSEGWLCPAMFNYFSEAPERLFVKVDAKSADNFR